MNIHRIVWALAVTAAAVVCAVATAVSFHGLVPDRWLERELRWAHRGRAVPDALFEVSLQGDEVPGGVEVRGIQPYQSDR
ncbi:hypothetical protein GCM10018980_20150 [Streptomyces capoamus]|uniref:Uncharacterized protein n=1 Tax=Streptomyces capoamus TaxID=68183 RepID=A0A919EV88_9ACTN|nr:hypothetical protein GCM10010501_33740 [Streptomyces libani subsp. rufus]GHG43302.1 hypothetical protein GCM10018980_20150 [Streptomyces capoamus]